MLPQKELVADLDPRSPPILRKTDELLPGQNTVSEHSCLHMFPTFALAAYIKDRLLSLPDLPGSLEEAELLSREVDDDTSPLSPRLATQRTSSMPGMNFLHTGVVAPIDPQEIRHPSMPSGGSALPLDRKCLSKDVIDKLSEYDVNKDGELDEGEVIRFGFYGSLAW